MTRFAGIIASSMLSTITIFFYLWVAVNAYPLGESQQCCPDDFVQLHKNCYYFSIRDNTKNWSDAEKFCKTLNSQLLSIETSEESSVINDYVLANKLQYVFWTSGSRKQTEGEFMWTATQTPLTYTNWCESDPESGKDLNCILLSYPDSISRCWINYSCLNNWSFACELTPTITSKENFSQKTGNITVNVYIDRSYINKIM